jgi:CRP/FNR family transcriptional regulator
VCSESSTVIRVPREVLTAQMQRSPGLAMGITSSMGDRIHSLHAKVEILSAGSVESRLAALLLDLAERFGDELDDGTVGIPIALSRQDLANLVSTTFETAIRVMSRWQKAGVLETRSDGFTLREVERLREAARSVAGPKGGGAGEAPG